MPSSLVELLLGIGIGVLSAVFALNRSQDRDIFTLQLAVHDLQQYLATNSPYQVRLIVKPKERT